MGQRENRWVLVGGTSVARRIFVYWAPAVAVALLVCLAWPLILDLQSDGHGPQHGQWFWAGLPIVWALQIPGFIFLQRRTPFVKLAARRMRVKGSRTGFSDIDTVMVDRWRDGGTTHLSLQFGKIGRELASVLLRSPSRRVLNQDGRELLAEVFRQSNIRLPEPPGPNSTDWDRVNWMNRPHYLTRDQAIAYVLHTPEPGDLLWWPEVDEMEPTPA